jgi:hypothetical protein
LPVSGVDVQKIAQTALGNQTVELGSVTVPP